MKLEQFNNLLEPHGLTIIGYDIRIIDTGEYVGVVSLDRDSNMKQIVLSIRASLRDIKAVKTLALLHNIKCIGTWGTEDTD